MTDALEAERAAALAQIEALTREFDDVVAASQASNADDEHDPEGATIAFERQQVVALLEQAQRRLADVDAALARRDAGAEDVVVAVVTRSETLAPLWTSRLALLFLDGSHTEESARRDQDAWVAKLAVGGTLAIHDVFPDPADGGQAPFGVYQRVVASGDFEELPGTGSLRLLRRER